MNVSLSLVLDLTGDLLREDFLTPGLIPSSIFVRLSVREWGW